MECNTCEKDVSRHYVICPHCEAHLGYPNIRAAQDPDEQAALDKRYQLAHDEVSSRSCEDVLDQFEDAIRRSKAVISRSWGVVMSMFDADNDLFKTYYSRIDDQTLRPKDSYFDRARLAVDATFFPYFHKRIHFAALSLNGRGLSSYGDCSFVLRDKSISHRTSVFEENTLVFCEKQSIPVGQEPPIGYRATWDERYRLSAAKLHDKIHPHTTLADFPNILLKNVGGTGTDEFIEVHTYGNLDFTAVERFVAPKPKLKEDKVLSKRIKRKLREAGSEIENI